MSIAAKTDHQETAQTIERLRQGDLRTLARALSIVENNLPGASELIAASRQLSGSALRIGITGPPGAGKSTLVDQIVRTLRAEHQRVAVVAVDPSSPFSGGALLGDRIRMQGFAKDPGVFIRSMASRGATGGIARTAEDVCSLIEAAGWPNILIETVGTGQDEIDVIRLADVTVLVLMPGMGDEVQSLKAGVMEAADIFVVNKSDRDGAEQVEAGILAMQSLTNDPQSWTPPIIRTIATTGEGVLELLAAIRHCASQRNPRKISIKPSAGLRLDHLGIAVRSIAQARTFYETLGLAITHEETIDHEKVRTAMLPLGESRIELLEPTEEDSTIARFLAKRGEGLHHIAMHVPAIDAMFTTLTAQGIRLASDQVRTGAGGHRYFFVHPASTGGVLLEIVGDATPSEGKH